MSYVGDPDDPGYLRKTRRFKQPSCNQNVTLSTCLVLMKHSDRNRICSTFGLSVCIFFTVMLKECITQKTCQLMCSRNFVCSVRSLKLYKCPRYGFPLSLVKHLQDRRSCLLLGKLCQTMMVIPHQLSVITLSGQTNCSRTVSHYSIVLALSRS